MTKLSVAVAIVFLGQLTGLLCVEDEEVLNTCSVHQFQSCHELATCVELVGDPNSWHCECPPHLEGDGLKGQNSTGCGPKKCLDSSECHTYAVCNSDAMCECKQGYGGDGRNDCIDVDECVLLPCHQHASCQNTDGGFICTCNENQGYKGDGFSCTHTCSVDHDCGNVTRYRCVHDVCVCRPGYQMGETECIDVNECLFNTSCNVHAVCVNTDGSYNCACRNGYNGDGISCTKLPGNCDEVLKDNPKAISGLHLIDPDGTGPLVTIEVSCEMRPNLGITIVNPLKTGNFRFYNWRTQFDYDYEHDLDSIKGIIATSGYCYQDMKYKCVNGATLMDGDDYWLNGNNQREENWGGAISFRMCACGELGFCANRTSNCNCDGSANTQDDNGRILDKSKLPVRSVITSPGSGSAVVRIFPLYCAPVPFDIPIDCHDAKFNQLYKITNDGPQTLDFDGPNGPLPPVMAHCDMETYPHAGVTIIPHSLPYGHTPTTPGETIIEYKVGVAHLQALVAVSEFCIQEAEYGCTNSRLMNNGDRKGYFSDTKRQAKTYWPGGMNEANKCGCAITGTCESANYGCNCDIMDGKTRKDWGVVTKKSDLPIGSVTLLDIGGISSGRVRVGPLRCSMREFGILATCQSYLEKGYTFNHTYLIDPDGPSRTSNIGNQPPFPVYCEITGDATYATTIVYHEHRYQMNITAAGFIAYAYLRVQIEQLTALVQRAVSCTQTFKYTCRNAPLHAGVNSKVKWLSRDGTWHTYFAGDGNKATACSCGLTTPSLCVGGGLCQCDVDDNIQRVDDGLLAKKTHLPVLQMSFLEMHGNAFLEVGPLVCKDLFPTCNDMKVFDSQFKLESEVPRPDGIYVIDPDGPLGVLPFVVTCTGTQTVVPGGPDSDTPTDGLPNSGVSKCYNVNYMSHGRPVSPAQVQALVQSSTFCAQKLTQQCQNAPLTGHTNYTTCDGVTQIGWAGSKGENKCMCGVTGTCVGGKDAKCNCDKEDGVTREDGGWLVDKERMAVCQVCVSLGSANSVPNSPKVRRVKPVVSDLYCDSKPMGQGKKCQDFRDEGEEQSGPRNIDPDGSGPAPPVPISCVLQAVPPMGWTEIHPKEPVIPVPPGGIDKIIEYYVFNLEFVITLIEKSGYCTQELLLECQNSGLQLTGTYGFYSRDGVRRTSWAGGCTGANCKCNLGGFQIDGGVIRDDSLLPIKRVVLGPASGSRTLRIGPVKCFDFYKDCEDIRVNKATYNPLGNNTYAIDADQAGPVEPFAVVCDFKTQKNLGITVVPIILPTQKSIRNAAGPGSHSVTVTYQHANYTQINALAQISSFCHQGMQYICYKSPLINFATPAQSFYTTYGSGPSKSFGVAGSSNTVGCACVATKTCPVGHSCHCDAIGDMTWDYGAETNRSVLPITHLNFGGQSASASAMYDLSDVRCSRKPFDLPPDCEDAKTRGLLTGEHLIWPSSAVEPFLVYCDMDTVPGTGVTVIGNDRDVGITVTYETPIKVKYHGALHQQVDALIDVSKFCYQPIIYRCQYTKMLSGNGFFTYKGGKKESIEMYVGAGNHFARECNCGKEGLCGGSEDKDTLRVLHRPCNCDAADGENRADAGIYQVRTKLPVKEMFFKNTGINLSSGHVTLGKLYCAKKEFDIDECRLGFHDCHPRADCVNKNGSYDCICKPGWKGYGRKDNVWANGRNCYDDDECEMKMCPWSSTCTNLPGDFECKCKTGFLKKGKRTCDDIDECAGGTHQCHANARCINLQGGYDCRCNRNFRGNGFHCEPLGVCSCFGDPHCLTLDAKLIDYQGLCQYVMARNRCDDLEAVPTFEVLTLHYRKPWVQANARVSWVKEVTVNYGGLSILLMQDSEVRIDGLTVNTPYRQGAISIRRLGRGVIVTTDIGLEVRWSGGESVQVFTPGAFANKTCGLCGNYNGDPDDDMIIGPECPADKGKHTNNFNIFGNSWVVPGYRAEHPECVANCSDTPDPACTGHDKARAQYLCNQLFNPNGKFKKCFHEMDQRIYEAYSHSCLYDLCRMPEDAEDGICDMAENIAKTCLKEYNETVDYRQPGFCEPECGENMEHHSCKKGNPKTCLDILKNQVPPGLIADEECEEGCFCKEGFVMDENKCVPTEDCGCIYNDMYLRVGDERAGLGCARRVKCHVNHTVVEDTIQCHHNAACGLKHGKYGCHCLEGYYGDGINSCDEDPCISSPCGEHEMCVRHNDKPNGYQCECNMGFIGDCGNCTDVDECLTGISRCPANSICINSVGSFECECKTGYSKFAKKCEDVNECKLAEFAGQSLCLANSKCVNTIGSYDCPCCAGYVKNANGSCVESSGTSNAGQPKCCVCNVAICDRPGQVCGEDGVTYENMRDMVIKQCEKGLPEKQQMQVDYFGRCRGSCSLVQCPKYQHCVVHEKTGKPTCVCDECTQEEVENEQQVCTDKFIVYQNFCVFKKVQCMTDTESEVQSSMVPCEGRGGSPVGPWSPWGPCSVTCDKGLTTRTRRPYTEEARQTYQLSATADCYEDPCPGGPCDVPNACENMAAECVVKGNNTKVCECPTCENRGTDPVCGFVEGIAGGHPRTWNSACHVQKTACERGADDYEVMHDGVCGVEPLNCTRVPHLLYIRGGENNRFVSNNEVNMYACEGGCGHHKELCCQPTKTDIEEIQLHDDSDPPNTIYQEIAIIRGCKCTELP